MANAPQTQKIRDLTLDIAKGLAIMLVIAGHTLQGMPDSDESIWFRAIYAFHMPFFIFLAGAVAATRPPDAAGQGLAARMRITLTAQAIGRSAARLLIPFAVWTVIGWYINRRETYGLGEWLVTVFKAVDYSLWFLLLVFDCQMLWQLWHMAMGFFRDWLRRQGMNDMAVFFEQGLVVVGLFGLLLGRILSLPFVTGLFGFGYVKMYLGYFALGALYYLYGRDRLRGAVRLIPYVVFLALVPFWYRTHPGPLSLWLEPFFPGNGDRYFRGGVALAGIAVALDIVKIINDAEIDLVNRFMAYCGVASLGIYAVHFYLLGYAPKFIAPLLGSLLFYAVVSRLPVARLLLLGETPKPKKIMLSSSAQADKFLV